MTEAGREFLSRTKELEYLNKEHNFPVACEARGAGLWGKIKNKLRNILFADYLQKEQEYFANLARQLNQISKYLEEKDTRKEDSSSSLAFSLEKKFSNELSALSLELRKNLSNVEVKTSLEAEKINNLSSVVKGLEAMLNMLGVGERHQVLDEKILAKVDFNYWLLENRFRGSEDEIAKRLAIYPEIFLNSKAAVLDFGCGRGELLKQFKQKGISSYGIELNQALVKHCKDNGLDVRSEDILQHLSALPDESLGGFIAIQVVEHLEYSLIREIFSLLSKKLKPNAKLVFETINVLSLLPFFHNYYRDPTHQPPLHPDTFKFTLEVSGFKVLEHRNLSPYPDAVKFQELKYQDHMPPRWKEFIETINLNFKQLNEILFSEQDYCIIAVKRE